MAQAGECIGTKQKKKNKSAWYFFQQLTFVLID